MELLYDHIHMERKKWEAMTQFTIEEDMEIPSTNMDIVELLIEDVQCFVEEVKVAREQTVVKGKLKYQILYTSDSQISMESMKGTIGFEEVMHTKGAVPGDMPVVKAVLEDFHVSKINPRKVELQSIVMIYADLYEEKDEGCSSDIRLTLADESVEKLIDTKEIYQLKQKKQDILRIKEEIEIQAGYQPIGTLIWSTVQLRELVARPMDGKISVSGDLECFFLYQTSGVNPTMKTLAKNIPFQNLMDSSACDSDRYVNVFPTRIQSNVEIKEDYDGEDRIFFLEASIDLQMRIYKEEQVKVLKDAYSTNKELQLDQKEIAIPTLSLSGSAKTKIKDTKRISDASPRIMQAIYTNALLFPEQSEWQEGNLQLMGGVFVQTLYATADEQVPYASSQTMIPYSFIMEASGDGEGCTIVEPYIEKVEAIVRESEEIEWRVVLSFSALGIGEQTIQGVVTITAKELDLEKYAEIPSMSICFVDETMSLWEIGKEHYMSVADIRSINEVNLEDTLERKPVLLVKGSTRKG